MNDWNLSAHHVVAAGLWAVGVALVIIGMLVGNESIGQLGILSAGLGGVINIRGFICKSARRDQRMFELGRDFGSQDVRSLR